MKVSASLWRHMSRAGVAMAKIKKMSRLRYSTAEWASLLSALRARGQQADLLDFHVSYLSDRPFRYALREVFFYGDYLFQADTDVPVILDCGANIGLATLFFKRLYPKARVRCFEADPTTASVLQKNIEQNHLDGVTAHNLMLSNADGEHLFYIAAGHAGSLMMSSMPGRIANHREILVKTGKLSDYVDGPVDLLKLDVEGSEFDVMTDLKCTGKLAHVRRMLIEYHHKIDGHASCLAKFLALLEEEGFEYQISGECDSMTCEDLFQDIHIGAYRPRSNSMGRVA